MRPIKALDIYNNRKKLGLLNNNLTFGSEIIDSTTGGLPCLGINEISGEAGSGKTQICLALSLQCYLKSKIDNTNMGSTAYLSCCEGEFPIKRLSQIASNLELKTNISQSEFLDHIHIEKCYNSDDVVNTLNRKIPEMCINQGIKLLVIDSLAAIMRTEYDTNNMKEMNLRTETLFRIASQLKRLADVYNLYIVVVNQVNIILFM
jgi:RecA/RadA recombinase